MIVVFDAQCLLCSRWVRFLLRHDRHQRIQFASMQGAAGRQLLQSAGLRAEDLQTLLVVQGAQTWQNTAAILRVLHELGGAWRLFWLARLCPATLRDSAYRWIARNRYRLFGRSETCMLPAAPHAPRFLD